MSEPFRVVITKSEKEDKRLKAVFYDRNDKKIKTIHFGAGKPTGKGAFPDHKDRQIRAAWIARHEVRGTFNQPMSASALSRYVLWGNRPSVDEGIKEFKKRFGLK